MGLTVKIIENNKAKVLDELEEAIERALEAVGLQAENYAKVHLEGHIDTGLLRNSITHALAGHPPAIASYHADKSKGGKSAIGYYGGNAPAEQESTLYMSVRMSNMHRMSSSGTGCRQAHTWLGFDSCSRQSSRTPKNINS